MPDAARYEPVPTAAPDRHIPDRLTTPAARALRSWEAVLIAVAIAVFVTNSFASPYFLNAWNLSDATFNFTEKAMIAFAMAMLIIAGEIDLSVASIIALASTVMGAAMVAGASTPVLVGLGLGTGLACGAVNGVLVARFGLPSIVVTIGTMSLFRGISYIVLGDGAYTGYPEAFGWFGQGYVWWVFSVELVLFVIMALVFGVLLHRTSFGRAVYAIGNNATAARFSGIRVDRVRFVLFLLTGLTSGIAAICLTSRLGSTRPSIATGFELHQEHDERTDREADGQPHPARYRLLGRGLVAAGAALGCRFFLGSQLTYAPEFPGPTVPGLA